MVRATDLEEREQLVTPRRREAREDRQVHDEPRDDLTR